MTINKFNYNKLIHICWLVKMIFTFTEILTYISTESSTSNLQIKICYIKLVKKTKN